MTPARSLPSPVSGIAATDWSAVAASLDARGYATTGTLLDAGRCRALADLYGREDGFRSRVVMQRHAFGRGEYKYFSYPLPPAVEALRHE